MRDKLRNAIATDIAEPYEVAPFELDHDITRRDSWMFAPLIAAAVTLPILATVLLGASTYRLVTNETSATSSQPTTFASRWPSREMPTIVVR
ncbi:MAG TPA: hypothetical protein VJT13_02490 [Xanthobacteraceae bacterium]|nr:hypothetical protein [Xanthobacteraceae bacterium]